MTITFDRKEFFEFLEWVGVTGGIATTDGGNESITLNGNMGNTFTLDVIRSRPLPEHDKQVREKVLDELYKIVEIREDEMARKANLTENIVTATGFFASSGALNWVGSEIKKLREKPW